MRAIAYVNRQPVSFAGVSPGKRRLLRSQVIDPILHTQMTNSFDHGRAPDDANI